MDVGVVYGRFQPLTFMHTNIIKKCINENDVSCVFVIQGEKSYKTDRKTEKGKISDLKRKIERNPFPAGIRINLIKRVFPAFNNVFVAPQGDLKAITYQTIKMLNKQISTLNVYCGPDEYDDYCRQKLYTQNEFKNIQFNIKNFTDLNNRATISASNLRKAIKENNYKLYENIASTSINDINTFNHLRKYINREVQYGRC